MNGNHEIDKDRYPYALQRVGDRRLVYQVVDQIKVLDVDFPALAGERIAAQINAEYYSRKSNTLVGESEAKSIARSVLAKMHSEGDLDAVKLNELRLKLS